MKLDDLVEGIIPNDKCEIHGRIFIKAIGRIEDEPFNRELLKRATFHGVKHFITQGYDDINPKLIDYKLNLSACINQLCIAKLTPMELMEVFPVEKTYKKPIGKTYFTTLANLKEFGVDRIIDKEAVWEILFKYINEDIENYIGIWGYVLDAQLNIDGKPSILPLLSELSGVDFHWIGLQKGKLYTTNYRTGEQMQLKYRRPKYIKVLK